MYALNLIATISYITLHVLRTSTYIRKQNKMLKAREVFNSALGVAWHPIHYNIIRSLRTYT